MTSTPNFHLKKLGQGEHMSDEGYKFSDADRDTIDRLLALGATHHHTGASPSSYADGLGAPTLTAHVAGGSIPAGVRVFYKVALVDPNGFESVAGPESYVDMPAAIAIPAAPALELDDAGGTLLPGNYYYVLSAYDPLNTQETPGGQAAYFPVPSGATNAIILHFPSPPSGATGYNIFRQKPGGSRPVYLDSVTITDGATPDNYVDDGSVTEDGNRRVPTVNSTRSQNSIDVDLPGAVSPLADGWTWRVYRTYAANSYLNSLLRWVVDETSEGSGVITTTTTDIGGGTVVGAPKDTATNPASPDKVDLATETTGVLPAAQIPTTFARAASLATYADRKMRASTSFTASWATTWATLDSSLDITLTAVEGDWIEVGLCAAWGNEAHIGALDVVSVVSSVPAYSWADDAVPDNTHFGVPSWMGDTGVTSAVGGSLQRQLVADDVAGGAVLLRVQVRADAAAVKTLYASDTRPLIFWAINHG